MTKYGTAKGLVDATKDLPYYDVMGAEYADEAFLPRPFRVYATCVPGEPWATDEEDAACMWAEARWSDYDHPEEMEALVTHSDGRKWRVTVSIEAGGTVVPRGVRGGEAMTESCSGCRFAFDGPSSDTVYCHRYPPVPVYGTAESRWPSVRWNDVCGEWAPPIPATKPAPADHTEKKP